MNGAEQVSITRLSPQNAARDIRSIPIEAPIAIELNGIGYAVMMGTPTDLEDFGTGFALSERIVSSASEIEEIEARHLAEGWLLKIQIAPARVAPMIERVRVRVSESSCGLCGLENLEQVARPLPRLALGLEIDPASIFRALSSLSDHQPLNAATGGVHAAAFCSPGGEIVTVREDVGRHTAFDKLIGALAREGREPASGYFLLSSRCSYELVEKAVVAGCSTLVTISTATSLAVDRARQAGLTLIALARPDSMLRFSP